jgi:hypothetical protein
MYLKTAFGICFLVIYIAFFGEALCKKAVVQQDGQVKRMAHLGKRRIQYSKRHFPGAPAQLPGRLVRQLGKRQGTALPLPQLPPLALPPLTLPTLTPPTTAPAAPAPAPAAPAAPAAPVDPYAGYYPPPPSPPPAAGGKGKGEDEEDEEEEEEP